VTWVHLFVVYVAEHLTTIVIFVLAFLFFARVLRDQDKASTSFAWILSIVLVPFLAIPAYLIFGGRKIAAVVRNKRPLSLREDGAEPEPATDTDSERMLIGSGLSPARRGNASRFIADDVGMYETLIELIENAEQSISIVTFIFGTDAVGRDIARRLCAKAEAGVSVRVLVDAMGSFKSRFGLLAEMERSGVQIGVFMRFLTLRRKWSANLRNHRKLALFDERTALTGGFNLASEYIGPSDRHRGDVWIDTAMTVRGPIVGDMLRLFEEDWRFAGGSARSEPLAVDHGEAGNDVMQLVPSGPDVNGDPYYEAILARLYRAKKRIWMVTPYFVPDEGVMRALLIHARSGFDVRLCVPLHSNHWLADRARARYLRRLLDSGGRVFFHPTQMIHAKHLLIDDDLAISGSANFDLRSFYLNFEESVFIYEGDALGDLQTWFEQLFGTCSEQELAEPGYVERWVEDISWLLSPLL
jgi:cardiolipin synthase